MIVQCPQCNSKYRLQEEQFARHTEIAVRCKQCGTGFNVHASEALSLERPTPVPAAARAKGQEPHLPENKNVALHIIEGPLKGKVFPLNKPQVVVGREGADVVVADGEVSRKHCLLEVCGPIATLTDLGSTNGTFVQAHRVESHELKHLSEFRVGSTVLVLTVTNKE